MQGDCGVSDMKVARLLGSIKGIGKFIERSRFDSVAYALHVSLVVSEIMDSAQLRAQNLVASIEMVQISTTKVCTGVAVTIVIKGARTRLVPRVAQLDNAMTRK